MQCSNALKWITQTTHRPECYTRDEKRWLSAFLDGFYVELMKKMLPHHPKVMELGTEGEGRRKGKSIFGGTINLGFVKVDGKSFCRYTRIEMGKESLQRLMDLLTAFSFNQRRLQPFHSTTSGYKPLWWPSSSVSYYSTDTLYSLGLGWGS